MFLPKFHIFSRSEKSWGDKEKRYINDDDERRRRTTNERTTLTIIIPRQDSQNPRANKKGNNMHVKLYQRENETRRPSLLWLISLSLAHSSHSGFIGTGNSGEWEPREGIGLMGLAEEK